MRLTRLVACSVLFTLSLASGKWLETKVLLPDSLGGLAHPYCFAYNPTNDDVYVGGGSASLGSRRLDGARSLGRRWPRERLP
jgi:hypothetical protein